MSRRLWEEARYLPGLEGARHMENWPDAFTPSELAALQFPDDADKDRRYALSRATQNAIKAGEIKTCTVDRIEHPMPYQSSSDPQGLMKHLLFHKAKKEVTEGVAREACAGWMKNEGFGVGEEQEMPSRFVRAWLGPIAPVHDTLSGRNIPGANLGNDEIPAIPGKYSKVASNRLAIKAAWQIECASGGRRATDKETMAMLQEWAKDGSEPELIGIHAGRAVEWVTSKGTKKTFDLEACGKALERWNKSRR